MNRLSFRPRPLDVNKKLPLVRSIRDVDTDEPTVSRTVHHGHIALDAENEQVLPVPAKKGSASEIPIPNFLNVPSYETLYPDNFEQPFSYIHNSTGCGDEEMFVEYDLDDDDERWLRNFNVGKALLSPERFEWILYRLELLDARLRTKAGAGSAIIADAPGSVPGLYALSGSRVPVFLQLNAARDSLQADVPRRAVSTAVYEYWKEKRELWGKPILRRLQPPPSVTDTNPYHVFRPREKAHRPHTRRMQRRENDMASYERMQLIQRSLEDALHLAEIVERREEKKLAIVKCEAALQRASFLKADLTLMEAEEYGVIQPPSSRASSQKVKHTDTAADETSSLVALLLSRTKLDPDALMRDGLDGNGICLSKRKSPDSELASPHGILTGWAPSSAQDALHISTTDDSSSWLPVAIGRRKRITGGLRGPYARKAHTDGLYNAAIRMPFTAKLDCIKLAAAGVHVPRLTPPLGDRCLEPAASESFGARIGRGGRVVFDRWNVLEDAPVGGQALQFVAMDKADEQDPCRKRKLDEGFVET